MAYRTIRDADLVRIVGKGQVYCGCNAVVIDAGEVKSRVQLQTWSHMGKQCREVICETIPNKNLLIRDDGTHGYVVDGRIDHEKKAKIEARQSEYCEYDDFDDCHNSDSSIMKQLIERVSKLETELLYLKMRVA